MVDKHTNRARDMVNPAQLLVHFPEGLQKAFGELAAIAETSEHFSPEMHLNLKDHAQGSLPDWMDS